VSEQSLNGTSAHITLFSALTWYGRFTEKGGYNQGYLATIEYKLEILRLKMGMYEITNDCKIQYLWQNQQLHKQWHDKTGSINNVRVAL